ncbi:MAG: caspase domain-containing protein [Xenococcus sp. (in: cyanobacteria)]
MAMIFKTVDYKNFFGIFIGVEKFPDSKDNIHSLLHANEDADEMCQLFLERKQRQERKKDKLCLLVNQDYKVSYDNSVTVLKATRANILRKLTEYLKLAQTDDLLLVYISTHGIIDFDDYFFIPSDGEIDNILGTGISSTTLIQALGQTSAKGVKVLMIIDTCHSGAISFDISKYKGEFSCLLSCSPVEYSYEYFNIEHGIFTNHLIQGLNGDAINNDGEITLISLYDYIYKNVQKDTKKQQNPLLIGTMKSETVLIDNYKDHIISKNKNFENDNNLSPIR